MFLVFVGSRFSSQGQKNLSTYRKERGLEDFPGGPKLANQTNFLSSLYFLVKKFFFSKMGKKNHFFV